MSFPKMYLVTTLHKIGKNVFFPDIANLTIMTASDNTVVTVALSAIQSDTVALFRGSVLIEYCRIAWIHVA